VVLNFTLCAEVLKLSEILGPVSIKAAIYKHHWHVIAVNELQSSNTFTPNSLTELFVWYSIAVSQYLMFVLSVWGDVLHNLEPEQPVLLHESSREATSRVETGRRGGEMGGEGRRLARQEAEEEEGCSWGPGESSELYGTAQQVCHHTSVPGWQASGWWLIGQKRNAHGCRFFY